MGFTMNLRYLNLDWGIYKGVCPLVPVLRKLTGVDLPVDGGWASL